MSSLNELIAQREALDKKIADLRQSEIKDAIAKVKALVAQYQLTEADVFGKTTSRKTTATRDKRINKVAAKYRDPVSGKEWSGRGLSPRWFDKTNATKFLIR